MRKNYKGYACSILLLSVVALIFAYILELFNIFPCKLCIYQRYVYLGLILSTISLVIAIKKKSEKFLKFLEWTAYCLLIIGISIGIFQFLVEKHWITYESSCTANISGVSTPEEFLSSINSKDLVACDVPQIEILNLSLGGWNVLYMFGMLCISVLIMYKMKKN